MTVFAYDYPFLGIFWTMLEFTLFFIWIWLLIVVFADIFRSRDMGGFAKLADLRAAGTISEEEFEAGKAKVLG
jgi:hypothetical protein